MLNDSGNRREFETGAVRDMVTGKGRCDLLPLGTIARLLNPQAYADSISISIEEYIKSGNEKHLYRAAYWFARNNYPDIKTAILELSKHYEEGAKKYGERNWEKGIPLHCFIDSGVRHYLKFLRGDTDEPHDRAFLWNMVGAIWTQENKPKMIDLPFAEKEGTDGGKTA